MKTNMLTDAWDSISPGKEAKARVWEKIMQTRQDDENNGGTLKVRKFKKMIWTIPIAAILLLSMSATVLGATVPGFNQFLEKISPDLAYSLMKERAQTETKIIDIPFETITSFDERFDFSYSSTETQGVPGKALVTLEIVYREGKKVSEREISREILEAPVTAYVVRGSGYENDGGIKTDHNGNISSVFAPALIVNKVGNDGYTIIFDAGINQGRYATSSGWTISGWELYSTLNNGGNKITDPRNGCNYFLQGSYPVDRVTQVYVPIETSQIYVARVFVNTPGGKIYSELSIGTNMSNQMAPPALTYSKAGRNEQNQVDIYNMSIHKSTDPASSGWNFDGWELYVTSAGNRGNEITIGGVGYFYQGVYNSASQVAQVNVPDGETYQFRARGYVNTPNGKKYSEFSSVYNIAGTKASPGALGAPTGLKSSNLNATSVTLSWNSVTGVTGYMVYVNGVLSKTCLGNTNVTCTVTGLTGGTTYTFYVRAYNDDGPRKESPPSNTITVTTLAMPAPSAPLGLTVKEVQARSLTFSWNPVEGATCYVIYLNGTYYCTTTTGTSCTISSLEPETSYTIQVRAENDYGASSFSGMTVTTASL